MYKRQAYDFVWDYVVPLAIPMLLLQANVKKISKDSGRLIIIYLISGIGTVAGGFLAFFALKNFIPELNKATAMMVGTYTVSYTHLDVYKRQEYFPISCSIPLQ